MRSAAGLAAALAALALAPLPQDQPIETLRIRGQVLAEGAGPLPNAEIKTDAIRGPNASQFSAQRWFTARTGRDGEWSLLGVTRGLWILQVSALDHAPHVLVVPIAMMLKPGPAAWDTSLALLPMTSLAPADELAGPVRHLIDAIDRVTAGDRLAARDALLRLAEADLGAEALCAAGDVALLLREPVRARRFFELASAANVTWYRPQLGIASASMMNFDFDRAMKAYAAARSATSNKRLERMLSGAIRDLQQIRTIGGG